MFRRKPKGWRKTRRLTMIERWKVELEFDIARDNTDEYWNALINEFRDLAVKHGMDAGGMSVSVR